jgi:hypothetical protein
LCCRWALERAAASRRRPAALVPEGEGQPASQHFIRAQPRDLLLGSLCPAPKIGHWGARGGAGEGKGSKEGRRAGKDRRRRPLDPFFLSCLPQFRGPAPPSRPCLWLLLLFQSAGAALLHLYSPIPKAFVHSSSAACRCCWWWLLCFFLLSSLLLCGCWLANWRPSTGQPKVHQTSSFNIQQLPLKFLPHVFIILFNYYGIMEISFFIYCTFPSNFSIYQLSQSHHV